MFQIAIDTNTNPAAPSVYTDELKTHELKQPLAMVQGFRGVLRVLFLGDNAPSENAAVAMYLRSLNGKNKLVQTDLGERGVAGDGTIYYDIPLAADTTALEVALNGVESAIFRGGVIANDLTATPETNYEWQFNVSVSASVIGRGEKPPVSPNAIEEHNADNEAHPFIQERVGAAEKEIADVKEAAETGISELKTSVADLDGAIKQEAETRKNTDAVLASEISEIAQGAVWKSELSEEAEARKAGDAENAAAIKEEATARAAADTALTNSVSTEVSERKAADSELCKKIATEISCRKAAISAEATARSAAISATCSNLISGIISEGTCRRDFDAYLQRQISTETTCRKAADSALSASIATKADASALVAVNSEITALKTELTELDGALTAETTARTNADTTLTKSITTEVSERKAADSALCKKIATETTCRKNAVSALCKKIATETTCRKNADSALSVKIATEISERKAAGYLTHSIPAGEIVCFNSAVGEVGVWISTATQGAFTPCDKCSHVSINVGVPTDDCASFCSVNARVNFGSRGSANFNCSSANFNCSSANFNCSSANFNGGSANFNYSSANFSCSSANFSCSSANFNYSSANFNGGGYIAFKDTDSSEMFLQQDYHDCVSCKKIFSDVLFGNVLPAEPCSIPATNKPTLCSGLRVPYKNTDAVKIPNTGGLLLANGALGAARLCVSGVKVVSCVNTTNATLSLYGGRIAQGDYETKGIATADLKTASNVSLINGAFQTVYTETETGGVSYPSYGIKVADNTISAAGRIDINASCIYANAARIDVPKLKTLTQAEYDALTEKDADTIYFIKDAS